MLTANRLHKLFSSFPPYVAASHPNRPFSRRAGSESARVWVSESAFLVELDLPGRTPESIRVEAEKNVLTVSLQQAGSDGASAGGDSEQQSGAEQAIFQLPFPVRSELTDVVFQHGVLRITVQRPAEDLPRQLEVRSSG